MSMCQANRRNEMRGFTLIEIMVVVVIIGLLAAIVAPSVVGNIDKAALARAQQDIRGIESALNLYRLDNFAYPAMDQGGLELLVGGGNAGVGGETRKQYLRSVPQDPWNRPYLYEYPGQRGDFDVYTLGADGQEGGEDINADIGNWDLN